MTPRRTQRSGAVASRHGRVRRWVVRPFFWGLAVLALLFFITVLYLESEDFEQRGSQWAVDWLEGRLQRDVSVAEMRLDLVQLELGRPGAPGHEVG